jgi:hypothetical protein
MITNSQTDRPNFLLLPHGLPPADVFVQVLRENAPRSANRLKTNLPPGALSRRTWMKTSQRAALAHAAGAKPRMILEHQRSSVSQLLSALLTVRFFSNQEEIFKQPFSRSAASRLGKSGLSISLVAAGRAAFISVYLQFYFICYPAGRSFP